MKKLLGAILVTLGLVGSSFFLQNGETQTNTSPQNSQVTIRSTYAFEFVEIEPDEVGQFDAAIINPTCTDCPINTLRATYTICIARDNIIIRTDGEDPTESDTDTGLAIVADASFEIFGYADISNFRYVFESNEPEDTARINCQHARIP